MLSRYRSSLLTLLALVILTTVYGLWSVFGQRPHPMHLWRHADCLSITLNYYDEGMHFGEPTIHNYISDDETSGKTAGEFPGWYYFMAVVWKILGVEEGLYRASVALLFVLSLLILQRATEKILGVYWSIFLAVWLFMQPALVYYAFGFLSNVPALSFALIGASYFLRFSLISAAGGKSALRLLGLAVFFFALGGLLKVTALLLYFTAGALMLLEWVGLPLWPGKKIFQKHFKAILIMAMGLVPVLIWYWWAAHYNDLHGGKYTFNGLWPLWETTLESRAAIFEGIIDLIAAQIMSPVNWVVVAVLTFLNVLFLRRIPLLLVAMPIILFVGCVIYSIFWFQAWKDHDYYFINLYAWPILSFATAFGTLRYLQQSNTSPFSKVLNQIAVSASFVLLLWSAWYAKERLELRLHPSYEKDYLTVAEREEGILKYTYWDHERHEKGLEDIEEVLLQAGIGEEDLVISIPDASFCITLYLMDRKGWSNFGDRNRDREDILDHIAKGAKYLVINEPEYEQDFPWIAEFMTHPVVVHRSIRVFDLSPFEAP